jgi:hypothetical protein
MLKQLLFLTIGLSLILLPFDAFAQRGGRGGGGGGGGRGGGGGFSGGARPMPQSRPAPQARPSPSNVGARAPAARPTTGVAQGRPNISGGAVGRPGAGQIAGGQAGQRAANSKPSRGQLDSFLGTNEGMPAKGAGGNFDVNTGTATGARGGQAAGITVTGPGGNTAGKAVGVGAGGGVAGVEGVKGAGGGTAARGAAVGPNGGVAAGAAARGAGGAAAVRGAAVGPAGGAVAGGAAVGRYGNAAAGFAAVTPAGRYRAAAGVRTGYNNWGIYGSGWRVQHPGAWMATAWGVGALWSTASWGSASSYCGYPAEEPVYYDYGTNVTYEEDGVYVDGQNVGSSEEYYEQSSTIAQEGAKAAAPPDGDWLPLGVFALSKPEEPTADVTVQLAINKEGIIRGNYTDTQTDKTQVIQGAANKETQKVAFTVGDNTTNVIETGLYNLTKDEAPVLIHFGKEKTEQWLLVRLENPDPTSEKP